MSNGDIRGSTFWDRWFQHVALTISTAVIIGIAIMIIGMRDDIRELSFDLRVNKIVIQDHEQRIRRMERNPDQQTR